MFTLNTIAKSGNSRLILWKKILQYYQNQSGALAHNNPKQTDTLRETLVKLLRALQGV